MTGARRARLVARCAHAAVRFHARAGRWGGALQPGLGTYPMAGQFDLRLVFVLRLRMEPKPDAAMPKWRVSATCMQPHIAPRPLSLSFVAHKGAVGVTSPLVSPGKNRVKTTSSFQSKFAGLSKTLIVERSAHGRQAATIPRTAASTASSNARSVKSVIKAATMRFVQGRIARLLPKRTEAALYAPLHGIRRVVDAGTMRTERLHQVPMRFAVVQTATSGSRGTTPALFRLSAPTHAVLRSLPSPTSTGKRTHRFGVNNTRFLRTRIVREMTRRGVVIPANHAQQNSMTGADAQILSLRRSTGSWITKIDQHRAGTSAIKLAQYAGPSPTSASETVVSLRTLSMPSRIAATERGATVRRSFSTSSCATPRSTRLAPYPNQPRLRLQYRASRASSEDRTARPATSRDEQASPITGSPVTSPHEEEEQLRRVLGPLVRESLRSPAAVSVLINSVASARDRRESLERYRVEGGY